MNAVVSEQGQVTIPKAVRDELGIKPGTILDIVAANGAVIGTRSTADHEDQLRQWLGCSTGAVEKFGGVDAYLRMSRSGDDDCEAAKEAPLDLLEKWRGKGRRSPQLGTDEYLKLVRGC